MEKKQTAVDWLVNRIENGDYTPNEWPEVIEQAKEMEKEQIVNAWKATDNELQKIAAEQYYNETYGKENDRS